MLTLDGCPRPPHADPGRLPPATACWPWTAAPRPPPAHSSPHW